MSPLDLIRAKDGSMSLTKLAAATAHLFMAAAFFRYQVYPGTEFNLSLWLTYGGFAVTHAAYDKTAAMFKDFKDRAAQPSPQP